MSRVLVLAGGSPHAHDYASLGAALAALATSHGHVAELVTDPDAAAERLGDELAEPIDALVIDGLWWRMTGAAYDAWRAEHGYSPPATTREQLARYVRDGGGLVALHTTPICFDDWAGWGDIVGGAWRWGVSSHPPGGPVRADVVGDHPVVAGIGPTVELDDEVYGDLDVRDGVDVLAVARRHDDDDEQPVIWVHRYGAGRVVFDCFGHDVSSIDNATNRRIIAQAIDWVADARAEMRSEVRSDASR